MWIKDFKVIQIQLIEIVNNKKNIQQKKKNIIYMINFKRIKIIMVSRIFDAN